MRKKELFWAVMAVFLMTAISTAQVEAVSCEDLVTLMLPDATRGERNIRTNSRIISSMSPAVTFSTFSLKTSSFLTSPVAI